MNPVGLILSTMAGAAGVFASFDRDGDQIANRRIGYALIEFGVAGIGRELAALRRELEEPPRPQYWRRLT
jgi:hypothetical protein